MLKRITPRKSRVAWLVFQWLAQTTAAAGDGAEHPLGDHPAVVVQRLKARAGYDYAAQLYPHPALLVPDGGAGFRTSQAASAGSRTEGPAPADSGPVAVAATRAGRNRPAPKPTTPRSTAP